MEEKVLVPIRRNRPTHKQMKTLQFLKEEEGISLRKAMLKAGYSLSIANSGRKFFQMEGVQNALSSLKSYVTKEGLTSEKMAKKLVEWVDATEIKTITLAKDKSGKPITQDREVADYDTQIKAYDRWEKIMGLGEGVDPKVKRRLTIDEYISEELK